MNVGKTFENDFSSSVNKECILTKRLNDNASSWSGGNNTRFTSTNECDYIFFNSVTQKLFFLELKTTKSSITFWNERFEKGNFQIKKNQILGLEKFSKYKNVYCGFIFNFRNKENHTYYVEINDFNKYIKSINKKSINENDVLNMNHTVIPNEIKKVHYKYLLDDFFNK